MKKRIVISVGGNALSNNPQVDAKLLKPVAQLIVKLWKQKYRILLTTGNGPQCGELYDTFTDANQYNKKHQQLPLDEVNAISQSYIGYHVFKAIYTEGVRQGITLPVNVFQTYTLVNENDVAWKNPTKPIGNFFPTLAAAQNAYPHDKIISDANRGYRKVVASPLPQNFVGLAGIKYAFAKHQIAVAAIGGGVPCVIKQHAVIGKEGVIDKDYSTSKLAQLLNVDRLVILTAVPGIYLNYGKPNAKLIGRITIAELAELIKTNDFGKGSMLPKINAAIAFVKATNKIAIITDLKNAEKGINLLKGTIITP